MLKTDAENLEQEQLEYSGQLSIARNTGEIKKGNKENIGLSIGCQCQ